MPRNSHKNRSKGDFVRVWSIVPAVLTSATLLSGCQTAAPAATSIVQQVIPRGTWTSASAGQGRHAAAVRIALPGKERKTLDATPHRWVAADIYEYRLVLEYKNASNQFVATSPPIALTLWKTSTLGAAITGLAADVAYRLVLDAYGNNGGTAPETHLNSENACIAEFSFTGNDPSTTANVPMQVELDPVTFNGWATVSIAEPADGALVCEPTATTTCTPPDSP